MPTPMALLRRVPQSLASAIRAAPEARAPDAERARRQQGDYAEGLCWLGFELDWVEAADALPDSCFVEDTAIIAAGRAITTRPGAPARRAEVTAVADALARHLPVEELPVGSLDGGDCLKLGAQLYVGLSERTSAEAVSSLAALLATSGVEVSAVPVPRGALHLKCVCSALDDETVLLAGGSLPAGCFGNRRMLAVDPEDAYAANVVAHQGRVLLSAGFPRVRALLEAVGYETRALDMSELRLADGSLSCLSILIR